LNFNWITVIAGFLLVSPLITGFWRGFPNELEKMKYTVHSFFSSVQWILSYAIALWSLRAIVIQNTWDIPQIQWIQQQLKASIFAWVLALPISALLISWFLGLFVEPVVGLLAGGLYHLQGWADRLSKGASRMLAVSLKIPKALLQTLIFLTAVHLALPYLNSPDLFGMAKSSSLYQWADRKVINPLLTSSFTKRLPVLGQQAGNWFHRISQEAVKIGPSDSKGFWTWQTRFDSNAEIDATARSIVQGAKSDREKAYRLYKWIGEHIQYDDSKARAIESGQFQTFTYGAIPTFQTRKGICSDYSSLMVAMGRAVGLEVKQEFGEAVLPDGSGGPHSWNVVYLKDENKWIPCDPTWEHAGKFFDNPDFYVTHHPEKQAL
jgi:hypothetical protein